MITKQEEFKAIIKTTTVVKFGTGDIAVGVGANIPDKYVGITFQEVEPKKIGDPVWEEELDPNGDEIMLVFDSIKSLEVLEYAVQKAKTKLNSLIKPI